MIKRIACLLAATATVAGLTAPSAGAAFDLTDTAVTFHQEDGTPITQAGAHPFAYTTSLTITSTIGEEGAETPEGELKDLDLSQLAGLTGEPEAVTPCTTVEFLDLVNAAPQCPDTAAVGIAEVHGAFAPLQADNENSLHVPIFSLIPPPGAVAKLGFVILGEPVTVEVGVAQSPPYNLQARLPRVPQILMLYSSDFTIWGVPADRAHDSVRGSCLEHLAFALEPVSKGVCSIDVPERPFLTMPRSCRGPLLTTFRATAWDTPEIAEAQATTQGMSGCSKLAFAPSVSAQPTSAAASSPTGLDFELSLADEGFANPEGLAAADIEKAVVTLPEGMTVNPAQAEGLEVCSIEQVGRESAGSTPGAGCPEASKVGSLEVETPALPGKILRGSLYVAEPYRNLAGDSLIALYIVIKDAGLGISVVQPARVESDPQTGRLTTVTEDMPEVPISRFALHFREGTRSPLATPPRCGTYDGHDAGHEPVRALFYPTSGQPPVATSSTFQIISGPGGGPCPAGGLPPFRPALVAGTLNNAAGSFSSFNVKLTRTDAEQEFTRFSIKLPPGVAGRLAGIPACSDAQIARAAARTGPHGGGEELADPSCPAASQVGRTLAGAGVGPTPAYAPGKIYLAGPYNGRPLSMVAITAGVVGPFDIGTVVVRLAIDVNPETGEVFLDSTGSDPIPHIIKGIPLHIRDIRAYTDRPQFTYNPTSCEPTSTSATVLGSGLDFVSAADDNPFVSTSPFQAADCAALRFKPKLRFKLKGSTKRAGNPSLRAHLRMFGFGEAAIRFAQVTLPKSAFLDQSHIGTVCTRVQFNAGAVPGEGCPAASIYGKVVARTPILDAPLAGPIYLRANGGERELPDLVAALHGQIDVTLVGFIDSGKNGGIRNTFAFVPDAPVTSADFTFFGGKKGLLDNSRNLCRSTNKVKVLLKAHSGKRVAYRTPLVPLACKKPKRSAKHGRR